MPSGEPSMPAASSMPSDPVAGNSSLFRFASVMESRTQFLWTAFTM